MRTRIQKWGNSLAVRIPKTFADETQLRADSLVELHIADGTIMLVPIAEQRWTLEGLLAGIQEQNLHGEWEVESAVGNEAW